MKYYIKTYGCQMNESDSERIVAFLEKQGYKSAPKIEGADLIVVNACSVRQTAIDRIFGLLNNIKKLKKNNPKLRIIITGCILKSDKRKFKEFLAPYRTKGSGSGFDEVLNINEFLGQKYLSISCNSAFVPIMTGCDNFCSYCVVPYVRGREKSRSINEIIKEVKNLIKKGHKEIILLGQNVNSYNGGLSSVNTEDSPPIGFVKLLKIINKIPGKFTIKFLTNHPKDFSDELIGAIANCKKIAKEIHLPIQSGDNQILKKMNRKYTVQQYKNLVKKIRKKIPNVKFSTDVIVGFPGETKKQFENTVKLFKEIKYSTAYINKYSPRAGTAAFKLKDDVSWNEKKRRWKILNNLINKKVPTYVGIPTAVGKKPKLIVILGPTATGKSDLAVKVAKDFDGEIISADSRQIYKEMDIGTGKVPNSNFRRLNLRKSEVQPLYIYKNIIHHCLDLAGPKKQISVAEYRKKAFEAIDNIYKKGKTPILCGGTGFYIQAVVKGGIPQIKPDPQLRKQLEKKTIEQLFKQLKKLDPNRAKNIDSKNKRRLIRAIEIVIKTKKPVPKVKTESNFDVLYLGIKKSLPELKKSINKRVDKMIKAGLEKEVKKLTKKYGWTNVLRNSIGYQEWNNKNPVESIKLHTFQFAKRQLTWFKKTPGKKVNWIKNYSEAKKLLREFFL